MRSSHFPLDHDGTLPHVRVRANSLPTTVLLVGDPDRMDLLPDIWQDVEWVADHREYRVAKGTYDGVRLGCCSTGIGGPATEIAVVELRNAGAKNLLRAGGCGGLAPSLQLGQLVLNVASVTYGGTSAQYAPLGYPAVSDFLWMQQIVLAAAEMGETLASSIGITTATYYSGQGRATAPDAEALQTDWIDYWVRRGITHADMESDTLLTVGRILDLRCASLLAVHADRSRGTWLEDYRPTEIRLMKVASLAASRVSRLTS